MTETMWQVHCFGAKNKREGLAAGARIDPKTVRMLNELGEHVEGWALDPTHSPHPQLTEAGKRASGYVAAAALAALKNMLWLGMGASSTSDRNFSNTTIPLQSIAKLGRPIMRSMIKHALQ
jgi:hypothetical protein